MTEESTVLIEQAPILGPPCGYVDLLDAATTRKMQEEIDSETSQKRFPIRPSSAGECSRALAYQVAEFAGKLKLPKTVDKPETSRIFGLGHSVEWHSLKQFDLLKDVIDIRYKQQVLSFGKLECATDPNLTRIIEGSLDAVLWSPKWKTLIDIKSKKDKFSSWASSNWDETDEKLAKISQKVSSKLYYVTDLDRFLVELRDPWFAANFEQLNMYLHAQFVKERGIDHGAIIQYNKNDSRMREIRFVPSETVFKRVMDKFQVALNAGGAGQPSQAPRDHVLGSLKCRFCAYANDCWNGADAAQAFFNTLKPKAWPTDTSEMDIIGEELDELFIRYEEYDEQGALQEQLERDIVKIMVENDIQKLKLKNGHVWEARRLKEGLVLRRGKK